MVNHNLPPLKRETEPIAPPQSWLSRQRSKIDALLGRAVNERLPWWKAIGLRVLKIGLRLTVYFGKTFPYAYRPWRWTCIAVQHSLDNRLEDLKFETVKTLFLRRLFTVSKLPVNQFRPTFAIVNWFTVAIGLMILPEMVGTVIEGVYVYSTYDTYENVVVTQAYRNITDQSTYAVHGYQELSNGEKRELYFEIGPNIWHWNLYPEFLFGQVPLEGRCTFDTFGITLRVPRKLRMFSTGSLYVLNPWIIDMRCIGPTIVPTALEPK